MQLSFLKYCNVSDLVSPQILAILRGDQTTSAVEDVIGVGLEEGSVIVRTAASFRLNDTVTKTDIEDLLKADELTDGKVNFTLDSNALTVSGTK